VGWCVVGVLKGHGECVAPPPSAQRSGTNRRWCREVRNRGAVMPGRKLRDGGMRHEGEARPIGTRSEREEWRRKAEDRRNAC